MLGGALVRGGPVSEAAVRATLDAVVRTTLVITSCAKGNPTIPARDAVRVDGEPEEMTKQTVTVQVRQEDGSLDSRYEDYHFPLSFHDGSFLEIGVELGLAGLAVFVGMIIAAPTPAMTTRRSAIFLSVSFSAFCRAASTVTKMAASAR